MQKKIELLASSVRSLFLEFSVNGVKLSSGTGFIAESEIGFMLITNRHNVTGRNNFTGKLLSPETAGIPDEIIIHFHLKEQLGRWVQHREKLYQDDKPIWYEHPILREKADVVAIPISNTNIIDCYFYDLNHETNIIIKPTDAVSVVGFPFGLGSIGNIPIWTTGFVASEPELPYINEELYQGALPIFLIDCRTREGQSGSPVIAQRNSGVTYFTPEGAKIVNSGALTQLLGIYSGRINKDSDIGMVWKVSVIKELIDSFRKQEKICR